MDRVILSFEEAIKSGLKDSAIKLEVMNISDSYDVIYNHFTRQFTQKQNYEKVLFIATRDSLAIAINNAALDLGLKVPQNVQTIGIIGTKNSRMARPSISIFDVDYYEVGSISTRMLTKMLNGTLENKRYGFSTQYLKRDSSKY